MAGLGTQHADPQDPGTRHGGRAAQELKRLAPALLALAGFAVTIAAFYPGLVTVDSIAQYEQALAGTYNDHHPPLMAWLWSRVDRIVPGPAGMLLLHAGLLWGALLLLAQGARRRGIRYAWALLFVGLFPPVLGVAGEIWKDVGMATSLLFATAVLYRASAGTARVRWPAATVALAAIFYATAIRSNAPAASAPIAIYWAYCVFLRYSMRATLRIGIGVFLALVLVNWGIDARLLHVRRVHMTQMLEVFDLAAIRCAGGDAAIPQAFVRRDAQAQLCDGFDSRLVDLLYVGPHSTLQMSTDRGALRELGQAWRRAVIAYPGTYLAHRTRAFAGLLGFGVPDAPRLLWTTASVANVHGFAFAPNGITDAIGAGVAICNAAGLYNGLVWLVLAVVVASVAWRGRRADRACEFALAVSAICYALPYFFVAIAPDYRYLYWTIVATAVTAVLSMIRTDAFAAFARRVADAARRHAPPWPLALLACAGFAFTIDAYRPGLLTFDSILQFGQSQRGLYWDHHPPLMAWTWGMLNRMIPGPLGMLLLQAALMWLGLLLFADGAARRNVRHTWIVIAIGFLPPIIGIEGEIWKDVQMAAALLFAAGLVYRASARREGIGGTAAALSLVALFYATAVRANAPAATGPMLVYWARCAFPRLSLRASVIAGATGLALLLGAQWVFDNAYLHAEHAYLSQFLETHDIAAIECAGGDASVPRAQHVGVGARPLCEAFDPLQVDFLFAGANAPLAATTDAKVVRALGQEWRRAIAANPSLYLRHRLRVFAALMGAGIDDSRRALWSPASIANIYGFTFAPNMLTDAIGTSVGAARALGLYNGIPWLAAALAVLVAGTLRARRDPQADVAALALAASAIAYALPYFLVAVAPDYRYLYWTIVATAVGAVLTLLPARRTSRDHSWISATTARADTRRSRWPPLA